MADTTLVPSSIRSDLVDTAVSFLKSPKIVVESTEKKRAFLQKKGLTDSEIDYAFKLIPQKETSKTIVSHHRPSFLRRLLYDLVLAGLLGFAYKLVKRWFRSKQSISIKELNETIKSLQQTVKDMQSSVSKLEQTADQLHLSMHSTSTHGSPLEEIKREIQVLKGLFLNRSQFPPVPQLPARIPSWQLSTADNAKDRLSPVTMSSDDANSKLTNDDNRDDGESIVVIPDNGKKSDDDHRLSTSPSSQSSNET